MKNHARREILALGLIMALALGLRTWNLGGFPDTLNPDEADNVQSALRILHGFPPPWGFFGLDWKPQPAFSVYLLAGFFQVFGENLWVSRLPSALFSTLALLPFWWLVRRQTGALAALGATFLLATNAWFLHFSRSGWENVQVALWMLTAMVCLLQTLENGPKTKFWLMGAAGSCALGLYGYFGGRAILAATIVFLLSVAVWNLPLRRRALGALAGTTLGALLLFSPQLWAARENFSFFNQRTATVLIFNSPNWKADPLRTAGLTLRDNTTAFWRGKPNNQPRYNPVGQPLLDRATGALLLLGMLISLGANRHRLDTRFWWTMLGVSWALTQLLSTNTPDGARGVGWMPTLFFFVALALEFFNRRAKMGRPALILAVSAIALWNVRDYFFWQSSEPAREARQPHVKEAEFEAWKTEVIVRAKFQQPNLATGDWRQRQP